MGGGDHFGGADPDAAPLDDGEVLHHHQHHPHFFYFLLVSILTSGDGQQHHRHRWFDRGNRLGIVLHRN